MSLVLVYVTPIETDKCNIHVRQRSRLLYALAAVYTCGEFVLFAGVRCLQERGAGFVLKQLVGIGRIKNMYPAPNNFQKDLGICTSGLCVSYSVVGA